MKKITAVILASVMVILFAACGKNDTASSTDASSTDGNEIVTLTISESYFEGKTQEQIAEYSDVHGFESYDIQEDGTLVFTVKQANYETFLANLAMDTDNAIQQYVEGNSGEKAGVKSAKRNADFTEVIYTCDSATISEEDIFTIYSVVFSDCYYYCEFAGTKKEDISVKVDFVDASTGESLLQD